MEKYGAELVDPRPYFKGSLRKTYQKYPHIGKTIPAMGYSPQQIKDLEGSIEAVPADAVVIATPMDLRRLITINKPTTTVTCAPALHVTVAFLYLGERFGMRLWLNAVVVWRGVLSVVETLYP